MNLLRFVPVALLLALLAGCSRRETLVERGNREKILHVGNGAEPADLDPQTNLGAIEGDILTALFEPLVQLDPVDLRPTPAGATHWEVTPDGCVYTLHLRPEARWSNGDPVRADDWVFSFRRLLNPKLAAPFVNYAFLIAGAEDFQCGRNADFAHVGVRARDSLTLEIQLVQATSYFPSVLSFFAFYPVHRATLEKFGALERAGTAWTRPGNLVSNGAFTLKEWSPGKVVSVIPNPHYWSRASVRLAEIRFHPVENAEVEERMYRAGELHATSRVPLSKFEVYRRERPRELLITPIYGTLYYALNIRKPPLDDVRVRRALALAIDRESIVKNVTRGNEAPALSFTPPGIAGYAVGVKLKPDAAEARRLLASAGFPGGANFPTLELSFNTNETHRAVAEAVQFMWKRELGIEVRLTNQEWKVYLAAVHRGDYQLARLAWEAVVPDPHDFAEQFRTGSSNNWTGWSSPEYDRILAESERSPSDAERYPLLQQLDAIIEREMPLVPIYHNTHSALIRPEVKGWPANAENYKTFHQIRLEP